MLSYILGCFDCPYSSGCDSSLILISTISNNMRDIKKSCYKTTIIMSQSLAEMETIIGWMGEVQKT